MIRARAPYRYAPFFCEENVWHLAHHADFALRTRCVVFVSNERRQCAVWGQRAAEGAGPVVWDYHVILAVGGLPAERRADVEVVDLDCVAGPRLALARWLAVSFPPGARVPAGLAPRFRVVDADGFVDRFASDRRHMRVPSGWRVAPPPWPPIGSGGFNLFEFVDMSADGLGSIVTSQELPEILRTRLAVPGVRP